MSRGLKLGIIVVFLFFGVVMFKALNPSGGVTYPVTANPMQAYQAALQEQKPIFIEFYSDR